MTAVAGAVTAARPPIGAQRSRTPTPRRYSASVTVMRRTPGGDVVVRAAVPARAGALGRLFTAVLIASTLAACAEPHATPEPAASADMTVLTPQEATRIVAAFDEGDSAASTAGDEVALATL